MTKSSASLVAAGGDLAEAAALTATANKIIQDADSVGTALKTTSLRLRGTDVSVLEEEGLDSDGAVTSKSKLQSKVKALSGVDILTATGEYKSTYEILSQIADVWSDINDMDQAALLELISGKRNSSVIAAILQNPEELKAAFEDANNASGSALKENEKYLDSIQGKIDQFNNAVQSMWSNFLDSDVVKGIVEIGTWLIKAIDKVGLLTSALVALAGYSMIKNKMGPIAFFKGLFETGKQGAQWAESHLRNLKNIKIKTDELHKATVTLTQAQLKEKLESQGLTSQAAEEIVAKTNLGKVTDELKASTLDATMREMGYSEEKRKSILQTVFDTQATDENSQANKENAASNQQASVAEDKNSQERKENIAITKQDNAETQKNTQLNNQNAQSNNKLGTSFKQLGSKIGAFAKEYAGTLIMLGTTLLTVVLTKVVDGIVKTFDEMKDEFDESVTELDVTNSELSNLESQLDDINKQIEELNDNTPLSFTDQEELSRLEAQSAEIQRQIDLMESLKEQQAIGVNSDAVEMADKYRDVGVNSGKTTSEVTGDAVKVAGGIGVAATGAAATMAAFGTAMSWNVVGWIALAAAAVTAAVGGIAYAIASSEEKVGDSLDNMKEQYTKLQAEYEAARAEYMADAGDEKKKKKFEEAQEAFNAYQSNMAGYMTEMDSYYSQIKQNWDQATTEQKQEYIEWQDTMDTWAIQSGSQNAKSNAIARIFGDEAQGNIAKARDEIKMLKKNLTEAKKKGEGVDEALAALKDFKLNLSDEEVERLHEIGIYLYEVEDYFKEVVEAESEFVNTDLEDIAKDINKITDGLESLKTAFDEVIEDGVLTAKTITSIKEALKLGDGDDTEELTEAWRNYLEVMMSGAATTDEMVEATERLSQAWIEDALANNDFTPDRKMEIVAQLRSLGVENALEYVDDLLQKKLVEELDDDPVVDRSVVAKHYSEASGGVDMRGEVATWTDAEVQAYADKYGLVDTKITESHKKEVLERYGLDAEANDSLIEQIEKRRQLEQDAAKAQNKLSEYNAWVNKKDGYKRLKEELDGYAKLIAEYEKFTPEVKNFVDSDYYTGNGYTHTNRKTGETISQEEYARRLEASKNYQKWMGKHQAEFDAYQAAKSAFDAIVSEGKSLGYVNQDGTLNVSAPIEWESNYANLQKQLNDVKTYIDDELTVNIQLQLDLQDADKLVDDIQNVYDTLLNAQKEHAENGYLSVDTLQSLLQLEPKYLDMLVDSEGNLNLEKEALQKVARARIIDLGIKQQTTIYEQGLALATNGSKKALLEHISAMETATEVGQNWHETQLALISDALAKKVLDKEITQAEADAFITGIKNQIQAVQTVTELALEDLGNTLTGSGNTDKAEGESEWERLVAKYENQLALITNERDLIEAEIDKAEARGGKASAEYYEDLIRTSKEEKALLTQQYNAMKRYLDANAGTIDQDTWTEYNNYLNQIAVSIKECETNTIQWQEALREIDIRYFEEATDEISRLGKELELVDSLLEDEEVADENGNWSSAALTRMAMYMNQIEAAAADTQRYQDEIAKLNRQYDAGELSDEQYQDRLATLTDGLYNSIDAQNKARDSIIELNEARIDAIKEGIEKEIEAYEDLIDAKKEELDAERDLFDFRKNIKKQTKDISTLERRIASLSGSSAASDVAERRRLEAQLMEAKEGLNDTYYDHSRDAQQNALDSEAESYRESQEKRIEELEATLDNIELLIQNSMMDVLLNADTVYNELNGIADTYGITLSDELTQPWKDASVQAIAWKNELKTSMTSGEYAALIGEGGAITVFANGVGSKLSGSWNTAKTAVEKYANFLTGSELGNKFSSSITGFANQIQQIIDKWNGVKTAADAAYQSQIRVQNVGGNPNAGSGGTSGGGGGTTATPTMHADGKLTSMIRIGGRDDFKSSNIIKVNNAEYYRLPDGSYCLFSKRGAVTKDVDERGKQTFVYGFAAGTQKYSYYAKGTTDADKDQLAIVDELGPELMLRANPTTGRLDYVTKGTGIVPADATSELMKLADIGVDGLMMPKFDSGINMMTNYITKPEFNFSVENFLKVDRVDQDTLPKLEAMMDKKIDIFAKQLNYSIKKFSR